jgi:hypothetical protein
MPTIGNLYTREEIAAQLGGGVIEYLPNVNEKIVCACLRLDYNPDAPEIILPGLKPPVQRTAELLCQQGGPIPIFIKRDSNAWEFVGDYRVERFSQDPCVILEHEARSGRIVSEGISRVIYMRRDEINSGR